MTGVINRQPGSLTPSSAEAPKEPASIGPLVVPGTPRFQRGYWYGMRQPSVVIPVALSRPTILSSALQKFDELHMLLLPEQHLAGAGAKKVLPFDHPVLERICRLTLDLLAEMRMPNISGVAILRSSPGNWLVGLPAVTPAILGPQEAFLLACRLMNGLAAQRVPDVAGLQRSFEQVIARNRPFAPSGINSLRLLESAHALGIPWQHVAGNIYQYGWGRQSRWLDSTFTDRTSILGAKIARDKRAANAVLHATGLPVPRHMAVSTQDAALKAADIIGYPVVVKPVDLDGGVGVLAGLRTPQSVIKAYQYAARFSKRVLVEQFVAGDDYRIRVCNRQVIGVTARRPASVLGDGQSTVEELINRTNAARLEQDPFVDPGVEHGAKPILVEDEVNDWLANQALTLSSVVPHGQRVRLRGAANWSLGGTIWDVTEHVHPDNLALAIRAVDALRLDIAGVDLLTPDITRPWHEVGAAICEVNAQPQFTSQHSFEFVLRDLCPSRGRIPVVAVTVPGLQSGDRAALCAVMPCAPSQVSWATSAAACRQAITSPQTAAIIWECPTFPGAAQALPFDRIDVWIMEAEAAVGAAPHVLEIAETVFKNGLDAKTLEALRQIMTKTHGKSGYNS
jgi:cyanophycin synthetase